MRSFLLVWIFFFSLYGQDPYKDIIHYTLENGIEVYLYPSTQANNVAVKVKVKVGTFAESKETLGAAHLLEHLLFRSETLNENETYLQILEEKGAEANGETGSFETDYFATIESGKGLWMVDLFAKIVGDRNILPLDVDTERKSVAVEIGKVSFMSRFLAFDREQFFEYDYFPYPPLYQSEFNLTFPPYSEDKIRLSNQRLTIQSLQRFYDDYYHPDNILLFVAGNFDVAKMRRLINKSYGTFKRRSGKTLKLPKAAMTHKPYFKVPKSTLDNKAIITLGTKYNELTLKERLALMAYLEDLSIRLMKKLRNLEGKTYTASPFNEKYAHAGIAGITLDTTQEAFESTYAYLSALMERETRHRGLTPEDSRRILETYLQRHYEGIPSDANTLLAYAQERYSHLVRYPQNSDAYEAFRSLDHDAFVTALERLFEPQNAFTLLEEENLFFDHDTAVLPLLSFIIMLFILHARYMPKVGRIGVIIDTRINTASFYRFSVAALLLLTYILLLLILTPLENRLFPFFDLFNDIALWSYYLWLLFLYAPALAWAFYYSAGIPKKELIADQKSITIKGLRSTVIIYEEITQIKITDASWKALLFSKQKHFGWASRRGKEALLIKTRQHEYVLWLKDAREIWQTLRDSVS